MTLSDIAEQLGLIDLGDLPYRSADEDKIAMLREQTIALDLIIAHALRLRRTCRKESRDIQGMVTLTKQSRKFFEDGEFVHKIFNP